MKYLTGIIKVSWLLGLLYILCRYLSDKWTDVDIVVRSVSITSYVLSFLALVAAKMCYAYVTVIINNYYGINISFREVFKIYNLSQISKYMPGGIWQFIAKTAMYSRNNVAVSLVGKVITIEIVMTAVTSFIFGLIIISIYKPELIVNGFETYSWLLMVMIIIVASLGVLVFKRLSFVSDVLLFFGSGSSLLKTSGVLLIVWTLMGSSFLFIIQPFDKSLDYVYVLGLYAMAYFVGLMIPIAPAGLGVREAIIVVGLSGTLPSDLSIILTSLYRIIYVAAEIILVLIMGISSLILSLRDH